MHRFSRLSSWFIAFLCLLNVAPVGVARERAVHRQDNLVKMWNIPTAPLHLIGNIYYVGALGISSFLIVTPEGDIIIDEGFTETAPLIETSIRDLGFKLKDVKILVNSHMHYDHAGGILQLKKDTGARVIALDAQVASLKSGVPDDYSASGGVKFPAVTPDQIIHDGDTVTLGGVALQAHWTPGHTKGCTTWTTTVMENGTKYNVVFAGSTSVLPSYRLVNNPTYPGIASDFRKSFKILRALPCDIFFVAHPSMFNFEEKRRALLAGAKQNPFIDPSGYRRYIDDSEASFNAEVTKEQQASHTAH